MKHNEKSSAISRLSGWKLSLLTVVFSTILVLITAYLLSYFKVLNNVMGERFIYLFWGILNASACYYICLKFPSSYWYVPVLCNMIGIISALFEPVFWTTHIWILVSIGWVLSIIGTFAGTLKGRSVNLRRENI